MDLSPQSDSPSDRIPADGETTTRRRLCGGCDRPTAVCLCDKFPTRPISTTRTEVVILHHPHERRHKLGTVPVLAKCLHCLEIVVGRRLRYGDSPLLDSLHDDAVEEEGRGNRSIVAAFLFPGANTMPSVDIIDWTSSFRADGISKYVLIAFDGTWKHAKEMVTASIPFLSKFATQVCLKYDAGIEGGTIFDSDLILRKEPFSGCVSTMEAIAHCLRVLEPNGEEIESHLVDILRAMVRFHSSFLKPMKSRPRLVKKGGKEQIKKYFEA